MYFCSTSLVCQTYGDLLIKQRFDQVYTQLYGAFYNIFSLSNNANDQGSITWNTSIDFYTNLGGEKPYPHQDALGSLRSGSLLGLLTMYEATCEDKYMWEFMEQATQIVAVRADRIGFTPSKPFWFVQSVYYHGRILMSFSKYVYLVKSNQNLYNKPIPLAHRVNFENKPTWGAFADWLNTINIGVMDYLMGSNERNYWRSGDECVCKPASIFNFCSDSPTKKSILELNKQAPFGYSLIYMYLANGDSRIDYGTMAVRMARAYLTTNSGVLYYSSTNNSYSWFHDGWQRSRASIFAPWTNESDDGVEDIGHAGWDIMFPVLYNKYYNLFYPHVTGGQYFENYQLVRFKNAFVRKVYNYNYNIQQSYFDHNTFNCNTDGNCLAIPGMNGGSGDISTFQSNAKVWTSLYKFDNVAGSQPGKVYDILMTFYNAVEKYYPINSDNYGGLNMSGLADMVSANYYMEGLGPCNAAYLKENAELSTDVIKEFSISNPATGYFLIPMEYEVESIKVFDVSGVLQPVSFESNICYIDKLSTGNYFVFLELNGELFRSKLMVLNR